MESSDMDLPVLPGPLRLEKMARPSREEFLAELREGRVDAEADLRDADYAVWDVVAGRAMRMELWLCKWQGGWYILSL
jgi:hypothetical protein